MYKKGMRVWIPHPKRIWQSAIILEDYQVNQNKLYVQTDETRETLILDTQSTAQLPPLSLSEDASLGITSNLSSLSVIHEATILHKLQSRFELGHTYSYCGISTVALNPYFQFPENEGHQITNYQNSTLRNLDPHVFGVAENAYRKLDRENCDQTIIFTGESGSGKSVNAERAILYLTTTNSKEIEVREKILASSVILQAFGNASTAINDDSSRFGKFVQLQYDKNYHVIGALLSTYNLDRSNVVSQGQRKAFNIFYCMYAIKENLLHLQLDECQFDYLKNKTDVEAYNVQNRKYFDKTIKAFKILGFSEKEQNDVQKIVAVLIHLHSLSFQKVEGMKVHKNVESCFIEDQNCLKTLGKILGLDEEALEILRKWICHKRTFCDQDEILQPMSVDQAMKARDALAKLVYTKLFNWLVRRINASFRSPCHVQSFIGILDMHGFEKLDFNSFEQFCINYIDEKVEQLFIESTFKLEQQEYEDEEIDWTVIEFSDNLSCIELIDGKCGILDLLEEETKMSSDEVLPWLENLHSKFDKSKNFEKTTDKMADFTIHHFIHPVNYNAVDFLAKNHESVAKEQLEALKDTKNELLNKLITDEISKQNASKAKRMSGKRSSLSSKPGGKMRTAGLRTSLATLLSTLSITSKSFVRCIKSNDEKKPSVFNSQRVAEQLRAFNIVETVKISKEGYFYHRCYKEFSGRYHCLGQFQDLKYGNHQMVCRQILAKYGKNDAVKFGKTKVFLRENTVDRLEHVRNENRRHAAIVIQTSARRMVQQKLYKEIRHSICEIQRYARGYLIRQKIKYIHEKVLLENDAATKIQRCYRGYLYYRWFQLAKHNLPVPQADVKKVIHQLGQHRLENAAATQIQKHVKSFLARRNYEIMRKNIILMQSYVRRFLAITQYKKLKAQKDLRKTVLHQGIEKNLNSIRDRIDYLMSMHLSKEDLDSVNSIMDKQTCVQTKNKILNDLLFQKIRALQDLRANQRPKVQVQNSEMDAGHDAGEQAAVKWRTHDASVPEKYVDREVYQNLIDSFKKVDKDVKALQETAGIENAEILKWMESHRNSSHAAKTAEIPNGGSEQNGDHAEALKEPIQTRIRHFTLEPHQGKSQHAPNLDLFRGPAYLQNIDSYATLKKYDQQRAKEFSGRINKRKQRILNKADRIQTRSDKDEETEVIETETEDEETEDEETEVEETEDEETEVEETEDEETEDVETEVEETEDEELPTVDVKPQDLNVHPVPLAEVQQNKVVPPVIPDVDQERRVRISQSGDEDDDDDDDDDDDILIGDAVYVTMFEFDLKATESVVHHLTDVGPSTFIEYSLSLDLPAQILTMCIRYADYRNDYLAALSLLHNFIKRVKFLADNNEVFHFHAFWLLNTYKLLNYLKQYSKLDKTNLRFDKFYAENTAHQNRQRLQNFYLEETWVTLEQTCRYIANKIIKQMKSYNLTSHAVSSLLYTEEMYALNGEPQEGQAERRIDPLLRELTIHYDTLINYGFDRRIIVQIFEPIFYYINSITLSHILSRGDLCRVTQGLHIRNNLRNLERWAINRRLTPAIEMLARVTLAVRLIQLQPLLDEDIPTIFSNYNQLSCNQVLRIVELYNANAPAVEQLLVSPMVIEKLKARIGHRQDLDDKIFLNEEDHPIEFPFRHSRVQLEQVEIPQRYYLPLLKKIHARYM